MPIHEYQCNICNEIKEVYQKLNEAHLVITCEKCGLSEMQRIISLCGARFIGDGFYKPTVTGDDNG